MQPYTTSDSSMVISYLTLRKAVGMIGILLPFVLAGGKILLDGPGIEPTVSSYYYTVMGDVFVGSLFAMAIFLLAYRGYNAHDDVAGDLAFVFAIGAALFPITPVESPTTASQLIGTVHVIFAALFFLTLAYFSLVLFRKSDPKHPMTPRKKQRNVVYAVCGYTMLAGLGLIALVSLLDDNMPIWRYDPIFWLEAVVIEAFGVSWLTKGEAILKDRHA